MQGDSDSTLMVHWECYVCGTQATCVVTDTAEQAWRDHMATHADTTHFGAWGWVVMTLPF